jgi:hypothetical protein
VILTWCDRCKATTRGREYHEVKLPATLVGELATQELHLCRACLDGLWRFIRDTPPQAGPR